MKRVFVLMLLSGLILGVGSAGGRPVATTTVTVEVLGKGRITSPGGINCGDGRRTCYLTFSAGVTLTASNTSSGWTIDSWTGCTPSVDNTTCDVADGSDATVTAAFAGPPTTTSTLSASYTGAGDISAPGRTPLAPGNLVDCGSATDGATPPVATETACSWTVLTGSTVTVFETPDSTAGNVFSGWGGSCSGTSVACTVLMDSNRSVSATWTAASAATKTLTVTVTGDGTVTGGGITCSGAATCATAEPVNGTVVLEATPKDGFVFTGWTGASSCSGTGSTCTVTMDVDRSVTATFGLQLAVTVQGSGNVSGASGAINCGTGADVCSAAFTPNQTVTLVATPALGATFTGWTGACGGTATTCTVLMTAAKSVTATFGGGGTGFTLTVAVNGNGTVTGGGVSCGVGGGTCTSANHAASSSVTLTAAPAQGATFSGWGGACSGTTPSCTVTFTSAKSVTASFQGGTSTFPLSVSVTGTGTVSGGGISCGAGRSTCTASEPANSTVTLAAAAGAGGAFTRWGGACTGTAATCAVTMDAAKSVTATFSGGTPGTLTISVSGRGTVSASRGKCAATGRLKTCVQHYSAGSTSKLTATPLDGASFLGWDGGCVGKKTTCTVVLKTAKSVTAAFSGAAAEPSTGSAALASRGRPLVKPARNGYRVTLRFETSVAGRARVRGLRAGRVAVSLGLRVAAGAATIGPFPVVSGGLYTFEVRLGGRTLRWRACLGRCHASADGSFVLTREPPTVDRAGDGWSITLHYRANQISDARLRISRGRRLLVDKHFLGGARRLTLGPFLLGPGNYTLVLTAADAYGRVRKLSSIVALGT